MGGGPRLPLPGVPGPQVEAGGTGPGPLSPGRCLPRGGRRCREAPPAAGTRGRRRCSPPPGGETRPPSPRAASTWGSRARFYVHPLSAAKPSPSTPTGQSPNGTRTPATLRRLLKPRAPRSLAPSSGAPRRRPAAGTRGAGGSSLCATAWVPRLRRYAWGRGEGA